MQQRQELARREKREVAVGVPRADVLEGADEGRAQLATLAEAGREMLCALPPCVAALGLTGRTRAALALALALALATGDGDGDGEQIAQQRVERARVGLREERCASVRRCGGGPSYCCCCCWLLADSWLLTTGCYGLEYHGLPRASEMCRSARQASTTWRTGASTSAPSSRRESAAGSAPS